jgi:hypothetical protein
MKRSIISAVVVTLVVTATWRLSDMVFNSLRDAKTKKEPAQERLGCPLFAPAAPSVYRDLVQADEILKWMFPARVLPSHVTVGLAQPDRRPLISSLEDTYSRLGATFQAGDSVPEPVEFPAPPLESFWISNCRTERQAKALLQSGAPPAIAEACSHLARVPPGDLPLLEKALLQRDAFHALTIFVGARDAVGSDVGLQRQADAVIQPLASVVGQLRFSEEDFASLGAAYPAQVDRTRFVGTSHFDLTEDYLPDCVLRDAPGWFRLDYSMADHQHYGHYRGRSFYRMYLTAPGMSAAQFEVYWDGIAQSFGGSLNVSRSAPALPSKSETVMVRTFGLFLSDWTFVDSGIVEEVLIRSFMNATPAFHPDSSDYRGTLHYQYLMDRKQLLEDPATLGLVRIADDEPGFKGLFPRAPDALRTESECMTVSRYNCIECHSEALYGTSTVFSLGNSKCRDWNEMFEGNPYAIPSDRSGRVRLVTPEFQELIRIVAEQPGTSRKGSL